MLHFNRANGTFFNSGENHARTCPIRDRGTKVVIGIQNNETAWVDRFCQRAFFLRDCLTRSHEFDVRDPDVGNDAGIGRGNAGQRGNFSRMIHAEFPNRELMIAICLQNRARQPDMIVKIALGFRNTESPPQDRCREILGRRLAVTSRNAEHL